MVLKATSAILIAEVGWFNYVYDLKIIYIIRKTFLHVTLTLLKGNLT